MTKKIERLIEILRTAYNAEERLRVIKYFLESKDARALSALVAAVKDDKELENRLWALRAIAAIQRKKVIPQITGFITDDTLDIKVRKETIITLRMLGGSTIREPLLKFLEGTHQRKELELYLEAAKAICANPSRGAILRLSSILHETKLAKLRKEVKSQLNQLAKLNNYKKISCFVSALERNKEFDIQAEPIIEF